MASVNTSEWPEGTDEPSLSCKPFVISKTSCIWKLSFIRNDLNHFGQRWNCRLSPALCECSKSEKFISSITPSTHLICRRFPLYFVWYFLGSVDNDIDEAALRKVPWRPRAEPLPDDIRSAVQFTKCKRQKRAGRKLSPVLLLISGWKRYFYWQRKIKNRNGERFEGSCSPKIQWFFFFTWKFFFRTAETFLTKGETLSDPGMKCSQLKRVQRAGWHRSRTDNSQWIKLT